MKLVHTDEQLQLIDMLRDLFTNECTSAVIREMKTPSSDGVPTGLWNALAQTGVFGLPVSPEHGGEGGSLYDLGLVFAEGGRALCPTIVYTTLQFAVILNRLGTEEQRKRLLPTLAAGNLRASVALFNPADYDDRTPRLTAEPVEGGWALNGTLWFVANADPAQVVLMSAAVKGLSQPARTLGFLVTPGSPGWASQALSTLAGDKQSKVTLTDVFVAADDVLSGPDDTGLADGDLAWAAFAALGLQCMEMVGGATAVLEQTVEYVKTRHQFNRPVASFQAVQHHVANMRIALETARLSAAQVVWWAGRSSVISRRAAAVAKMHCSEAYKWTTLTCHQLQGGMGYVRETDLHMWSERAKTTEILGGTADVAAGWLQQELGLVS